ncbi:MAG: MoaF N-terminal domain-containing protein [Steroidobacteraceae bacterium]
MRQLKPIEPLPPIRRDMDIAANRLPSSQALENRTIELQYEDGAILTMAFDAEKVRWTSSTRHAAPSSGEGPYDAVDVRPGLFFVDYVHIGRRMAWSHVVDTRRGRALSVASEIVEAAKHDLLEQLMPARLAGRLGAYEPIETTRELLGKRLVCEYSREAALEHIYVNSATIVWQWLLSPPELALEVGVEAVSMWKIAEQLYLICTRGSEPIQLTLLLDLQKMRNVGRLFGWGSFGLVDRRCGAKITFLGEFAYPGGYSPG